ncbi:PAS domain S-box protein [Variovorax dokdonensis]|uniref:histidine kinase n=1 Tax=Variovorax dokdonensis TaxID=344883 RepID=A0ABT7NFY3_9BURK|nr:PAS domain S-box protein [Variovorax dokdonensis]MDM0046780.1 PAS domain S-box protein [Variovorax dokdonensis]
MPPAFDDDAVFRSVFAASPDALLVVDQQGAIQLANPAACDLLGYSAEALSGLHVDALVPDAVRPQHAAYRAAYAAHPRPRPMGTQMDLVARRQDGSSVRVEIALSPLQDHGLPYVVAAIRSVAEYPRVKQALQRARYAECLAQFGRLAVNAREPDALLAQAAQSAVDALQIELFQIRLLQPNGAQWRVAASRGVQALEAVGEVFDVEPGSAAQRVLQDGKPMLFTATAADGNCAIPGRYLDAGMTSEVAAPLANQGRPMGVACAFSARPDRFGDDEIRFLEALSNMVATVLQRIGSEDALKHAQRLESVGQLTGGIAHDFNNLLTVISGNLQILQEIPAIEGDPLAQPLITAASRAAQRGGELTAKLLAFSRRQVLQPTVVDVAGLLQSLAGMLRRTIDPRIVIGLDLRPGMNCLADPVQLESSVLNVAINARDAMPAGGTLTFSCRPAQTSELPPELAGVAHKDGYVVISIADNGTGMTPAVRERAFEPFFTTKESGRGTGLGLATVYGFARQSSGAVQLTSSPGLGTTLTLYLPRATTGAEADSDSNAPARVPCGMRVLLVEDDPEVMAVTRTFLASLECEVMSCANAHEALGLLASQPIDILVTDVLLGPGMRGDELAAQARLQMPHLPVLLLSGFSGEMPDARGHWPLLRKPYTRAQLETAIETVLNATR